MSVTEQIIERVKCMPKERQWQVLDFVQNLEIRAETAGRGARMARALEELAKLNAVAEINDPVTWQRDLRADRQLSGRED